MEQTQKESLHPAIRTAAADNTWGEESRLQVGAASVKFVEEGEAERGNEGKQGRKKKRLELGGCLLS